MFLDVANTVAQDERVALWLVGIARLKEEVVGLCG
jgi:hypothetical protein